MPMTIPLTILATGRIASGLFLFLSPRTVGAMSSLPHGPSSSVLGHLVGARDLALGVLLYTADKGEQTEKNSSRRELKRALLASIVVDAAEVATNILCYTRGEMSTDALLTLGGGAAMTSLLGLYSYLYLA